MVPTSFVDRGQKLRGAFQGNVAMQVTQPGGQLWNQAMQVTSSDDQCGKASDSIWWENVQLMQVVPCGGQICN